MKRFLATNNSGVLLFQRILLGLVMFPHGMQKLLGWASMRTATTRRSITS